MTLPKPATAPSGTVRRLLLAALFFVVATLIMLQPPPWRHVVEACDTYLNAWILSWVAHALGTPGTRLFDGNIFYPLRKTLALSEHMIGAQPFFAPAYAATGDPVLATNVVVLSSFVLNGVTMTALAFYVTRRFGASLVAGFVWAFVPVRNAQLAHVQLLSFQWLPLAVLFGDRLLRTGRGTAFVGFAGFTLWQCLNSYYLAYISAVVLGAYGAVLALRLYARGERVHVLPWAAALVVVALAMLPLTTPYAKMQRKGIISDHGDEAFVTQYPDKIALADPILSWVTIPKWSRSVWSPVLTAQSRHVDWEKALFPGVLPVMLALGGGLAALAARRRRSTGGDPQTADVVCGLLAAMAACWVLALGPWLTWNDERTGIRLPAYLLAHAVPGFSGIRAWSRFGLGVIFGLAPLAAIGLSRLTARGGRPLRAAASVAAVAILVIEYRHVPIPAVAPPPRATGGHAWLSEHGNGRPLLILPTGMVHPCVHARYMLQTTLHWLPLASGYSGHTPPMMWDVNTIGLGLPDAEAVRRARQWGIRWVLVELDGLAPEQRAAFARAEADGRLVPVARFDGELVYDLRVGRKRPRPHASGMTADAPCRSG